DIVTLCAMSACPAAVSLGQTVVQGDTAARAAAQQALSLARWMRGRNDSTVTRNLEVADSLFKLVRSERGRREVRVERIEHTLFSARPARALELLGSVFVGDDGATEADTLEVEMLRVLALRASRDATGARAALRALVARLTRRALDLGDRPRSWDPHVQWLTTAFEQLAGISREQGGLDSAAVYLRQRPVTDDTPASWVWRYYNADRPGKAGEPIFLENLCTMMPARDWCVSYDVNANLAERGRLERYRFLGDAWGEIRSLQRIARQFESVGADSTAAVYLDSVAMIQHIVGDSIGRARTLSAGATLRVGRTTELALSISILDASGSAELLRIADRLERAGRPDSALVVYSRALETARDTNGGQDFVVDRSTLALRGIARLLALSGHFDAALDSAVRAIRVTDGYVDPARQDPVSRYVQRAFAHRQLANLYHRVLPQPELRRAVVFYDSASSDVRNALAGMADDAARIRFSELSWPLYTDWVLAWAGLYGIYDSTTVANFALGALEEGRAAGLQQMRGARRGLFDRL
ncbi:MAG: tetratricopeptide repeat protein, partial [bacterium]